MNSFNKKILYIIMMCINYILLVTLLIIFLLMCINNNKIVEGFDPFSPYMANQQYPFVYEKQKDQAALRSTLKKWEVPFNTNNSGYWYVQHKDNPPYVNLNSFEDLKQVRFFVPKDSVKKEYISPPTFDL